MTLVCLNLAGVHTLKSGSSSRGGGALNLPWHDELCCDSPHTTAEEKPPEHESSNKSRPLLFTQCNFRSEHHHNSSGDNSVIKLRCFSHFSGSRSGSAGIRRPAWPVICEGNSSLTCSVVLDALSSDVVVTITVANVTSSPAHLKAPAKPVKPGAPVNLSHHQTINAELVLNWDPPPGESGQLRYEVLQRSSNETHSTQEVLQTSLELRMFLDLEVNINYSLQVRCSAPVDPPVWSDWSKAHHISLDIVSYVPEIVKARPDEAVTVFCVFNDPHLKSSSAQWTLNYEHPLPRRLYHPVNQRVSQITVRPSDKRMYELLQCTQEYVISYSHIFVQGAAINITCQTDGSMNEMECTWKSEDVWFRWADLLCDEMEQREREGEELGSPGPTCLHQKSCRLRPLRMTCYRLWLEIDSPLGPITSKPIYVSPVDHVKPDPASHVLAVTLSSGLLSVTWDPPSLPVEGVQCQFRYHAPSTMGQPEWNVQPPVLPPGDKVNISDVCVSYAVQVRCQPTHGFRYWSDWSKTVYSAPQNSQAPERGPDFWREFSHDANGNRTTVTLLFERVQTSGLPYCVDGLIITHQPLNGSASEERTGLKTSHSFEWDHGVQTLTVATYNSLGRSAKNFKLILNEQVKRRTVRSFHVFLVNSSCVSLSWSLVDSSSVPQSLVLQWNHSHQESHKSTTTWRRLRYTDPPVHVRGDFFGSEEHDFYLFPVFADGEGQNVHTRAVRREAGAFILLIIVSFLSIVLLVTLVLSQNQMKKIVWKDVPNPNKCSWAQGMDTFDHLLRAPEVLPAWPLLLAGETISTVVIMDKTDPPVLVQPPLDPPVLYICDFDSQDNEKLLTEAAADNTDVSNPDTTTFLLSQILDPTKNDSASCSVTYATVVLSDPKLNQHFQDSGGCSSCDEGNFSANNSDISDSSHGALWELESSKTGDSDVDQRHSGSYNSVEEMSKSSDQEDENKQEIDLYYLTLTGEDSREEGHKHDLLKRLILSKENCSLPLLNVEDDSDEKTELLSAAPGGFSPLYLPQFRTCLKCPESVC
uniref:Fibronectin type-III domain-containing protein n=1 Tax=Periophthalmus magnuspinnatus TaxID=409849 RepID=A0A3B4AZY3_9GOBI